MSPRFSIVIPTRNRAGLLRGALTTALAQTHDDVEIVVSDNASHDDTAEVVSELGDDRVRFVRADQPLSQPDSWEFALSHATGDHVTLLGDDDGVVATLFERIDAVIGEYGERAVAWGEAWYTHPECPPPGLVPGEENVLTVEAMGGGVREVDGRAQLERFFSRREVPPLPGLVNSAVPRAVLDRIRARIGRVFVAPDPAVATMTSIFALEPGYVAVDQPLGIRGLSGATLSVGLSHADPSLHATIQEFDTADLFTRVPLRRRTGTGLVAESLLRMKEVLPDELAPYELDLVAYFVQCRQELGDPRRRPDDGEALEEWRRVLAEQPGTVRSAVHRELRRNRLRGAARRVVRRLPGARRRQPGGDGFAFQVVEGASHGFADVVGAARFLDAHALAPAADVEHS